MSDIEPKINQGFDRNIDYEVIKNKLVRRYTKIRKTYKELEGWKRKMAVNKLIYLTIAMIQLRNGSRISEACSALRLFVERENVKDKVIVKIAKSEGMKYNRAKKEKVAMKARFRKIMFPSWIDSKIIKIIKENHSDFIKDARLKKRVLDYLLLHFDCNTHSLRYAFINYMLYDQKRPMNDVSKFVGHTTVNQLVTYTQQKNTDQIFDLDI